jgi:hypothetical protein
MPDGKVHVGTNLRWWRSGAVACNNVLYEVSQSHLVLPASLPRAWLGRGALIVADRRIFAMRLSSTPLRRFAGAVAVVLGFALATAGFLSGVAAQEKSQEKPKASPPVLVTSLGQSLDAFQVQLAVRRAGIAFQYDPRAEVDKLAEVKTVFLAVGASLKGFGDAGITIKDELARAGHLLDAAKSRGIFVVVLHVGGEERRDALSNQLIELAAPRAHRLIIREDSDADGLFAGIAKAGNIPLVIVDNVINLRQPLQALFAGG